MQEFFFAPLSPEHAHAEAEHIEALQEERRAIRRTRFDEFLMLARNANDEREKKAQEEFCRLERKKWDETLQLIQQIRSYHFEL